MNVVNLFPSQPDLPHYPCPRSKAMSDYHVISPPTHSYRMQCLNPVVWRRGSLRKASNLAGPPSRFPRRPRQELQIKFQERSRRALRCNIARALLGDRLPRILHAFGRGQPAPAMGFCGIDRLVLVRGCHPKASSNAFRLMLPEEAAPLDQQVDCRCRPCPGKIGLDEAWTWTLILWIPPA